MSAVILGVLCALLVAVGWAFGILMVTLVTRENQMAVVLPLVPSAALTLWLSLRSCKSGGAAGWARPPGE
jgi:hypothetical protein